MGPGVPATQGGSAWRPEISCLRVTLAAEASEGEGAATARAVHAALLRLLEKRDPELSRRVHEMPINPIALWPDQASSQNGGGRRDDWRLALLHPWVTAAFSEALIDAAAMGEIMTLDWRPFRVAAVTQASPALTYADLFERAQPDAEITLQFITPAVFCRGGDQLRNPEPRLVFGSFLRRWKPFSPVPLDLNEAEIVAGVRLVDARLEHRQSELFTRRFSGFTGTATYRVEGDEPFRRAIAALAAYARWCGTGAKTAMGMGRTERIA